MTMVNESHRNQRIDAPDWTDHKPFVVDGFDPIPREVPFKIEERDQQQRARVPLGHIVNMGDFTSSDTKR